MTAFEIYAKQRRLDLSTDASGNYRWSSTLLAAEAFEAGMRSAVGGKKPDNLRDAGPAPFGGRNAGLKRD